MRIPRRNAMGVAEGGEEAEDFWKISFYFSSRKISNLYTPPYGGGDFMRIPRRNTMGVATTQAPLWFRKV